MKRWTTMMACALTIGLVGAPIGVYADHHGDAEGAAAEGTEEAAAEGTEEAAAEGTEEAAAEGTEGRLPKVRKVRLPKVRKRRLPKVRKRRLLKHPRAARIWIRSMRAHTKHSGLVHPT